MNAANVRPAAALLVSLAIALFLLAGAVVLPMLGVQNDEAVSVGAFHPPRSALGAVETPLGELPLMQVSYAGTLKSWLYRGVFAFSAPSKLSIRLPVLLLGALTLWLFYLWLRDAASVAMALLGVVLLASDPSFILTTCFDWGPVALQHLLFGAGVLAFARFAATDHVRWLLLGCGAFGLGLWDKALFVWMLSGAAGATLLVYRSEALALLNPRRAALGAATFCLAASPLLFYNLSDQGTTAGAFEAQIGAEHVVYRVALLADTLDGSALGRYMLSAPPPDAWTRLPETPMPWLFVLALLLTPWRGVAAEQRLRRWAAVAFLIAFPQTLIGKDVGVGSHHTVLLWPLPHLVVAGWLASLWIRRRLVAASLVAACLAANVAVLSSFVRQADRDGSGVIWTTAIDPLHAELVRLSPERIRILDWGVYDALRVLGEGALPIENGMDPFLTDAEPGEGGRQWLAEPGVVYVDHSSGRRVFGQIRPRFDRRLAQRGLRIRPISHVRDRKGRTVFEIFAVTGPS